jgi:hypothetical protein
MDYYYVLRRGKDFRILFMDQASALEWVVAGWEVLGQNSKEEAEQVMIKWKAGLWAPPIAIRTNRAA